MPDFTHHDAGELVILELYDQVAELRERVALAQEELVEMTRDAGASVDLDADS